MSLRPARLSGWEPTAIINICMTGILGAEMDVEDMVPGENSGEIKFQLGDAYELVSYDHIQVTVTEKGPSADSTTASTDEGQEGTESETSEGPVSTSKAETGQ